MTKDLEVDYLRAERKQLIRELQIMREKIHELEMDIVEREHRIFLMNEAMRCDPAECLDYEPH